MQNSPEDITPELILHRIETNLRSRKEINPRIRRNKSVIAFLNESESGFGELAKELTDSQLGNGQQMDKEDFKESRADDFDESYEQAFGVPPLSISIETGRSEWIDLARKLNIDPRLNLKTVKGNQIIDSIFGLNRESVHFFRKGDYRKSYQQVFEDGSLYSVIGESAKDYFDHMSATYSSRFGIAMEYKLLLDLAGMLTVKSIDFDKAYDCLDALANEFYKHVDPIVDFVFDAEDGIYPWETDISIYDEDDEEEDDAESWGKPWEANYDLEEKVDSLLGLDSTSSGVNEEDLDIELGKDDDWDPASLTDESFGSAMPLEEFEQMAKDQELYDQKSAAREMYDQIIMSVKGDIGHLVVAAYGLVEKIGLPVLIPTLYSITPTIDEIMQRDTGDRDEKCSPFQAVIMLRNYLMNDKISKEDLVKIFEKKGYNQNKEMNDEYKGAI